MDGESNSTVCKSCPHCGSTEPWGASSWCPDCGYYPALGGQAKAGCSEIFRQKPTEEEFKLKQFFPLWAVVLAAGVIAVIGLSFVASAILPDRGIERLLWTLTQCVLGMVAAFIGQFSAFLYAASKDDRYGPMDAFMKPIEIWKMATRTLPAGAWRLWLAGWGLTAVICGATIVGALRYEALFEDWGIEKKADKNLLQKVVEQAREEREGGADSLEGAMNDFVGEEDAEKIEDPLAHLPTMDCLIFGYVEREDGDLDAILLASVVGKDVRYVGRVPADNIPKEVRGKLLARMKGLTRKKPFVQTNDEARWLKPVLMARIAYTELTRDNQMVKAYVKVMLADLKDEK
jgi:hypothetical protein